MYLRNTAPNSTNTYYRTKAKGGISPCIDVYGDGSTLPNCVGYAWGAFSETLGFASKLKSMNAESFYNSQPNKYERGSVPKLGAIICWQKGATLSGTDGAGHVAQVIKVSPDGTITTANSGYKGRRFWLQKIKPPYNIGSAYKFLGFIYVPVAEPTPTPEPAPLKSIDEIARECIRGYWGNGAVRKNKLIKAGYDYSAVQARVNEILNEQNKPTPTPAPVDNKLRIGDEVELIGRGNANSFGTGVSTGGRTIGWKRKILDIKTDGRSNPIRVGNDSGTTGWFKASALRKI